MFSPVQSSLTLRVEICAKVAMLNLDAYFELKMLLVMIRGIR
jgi:hypothetical protein